MSKNKDSVAGTSSGNSPYRVWERIDRPSRCSYHLAKSPAESPHAHLPLKPPPQIMSSILDSVNNTPLVRLNKIPVSEGIHCEVLGKCEFFSPAGSVKDRIGLRMIEDAERAGVLKPGHVLIEPTSGNTGIGVALTAAVKGYRCVIVMPERMSMEKVDVLRALGAEIVRTPTGAAFDSPESHLGVAKQLMEETPNSHILNQFSNASNPLAHYDWTAQEILNACNNKIDMVVVGAGTGGTLTGIARKMKETCPSCKIIGIDPDGSILAEPEALNKSSPVTKYEVEGTGKDFVPVVLDRKLVDRWYKSTDERSFLMARRLIKEEGLLVGGSSGAAVYCAIQAIKDFDLKEGQRCVVILPDTARNYMSKFLSDDWMLMREYIPLDDKDDAYSGAWWWKLNVSALSLRSPITVAPTTTIADTLELLNKNGFDQVPVADTQGVILGLVTVTNIMTKLMRSKVSKSEPVCVAMCKQFKQTQLDTTLGQLSRMLDSDACVLILQSGMQYEGGSKKTCRQKIVGVATRIDLLNFIFANEKLAGK